MEYKKCNTCGLVKELSDKNFVQREYNSKKTGELKIYWSSKCKLCKSIHNKKKYQDNKEIILNKASEYREKNRSKIKESMREYNSRPKVKEKMRNYRVKNRKELRQKEKEWRIKNPEKAKEISKRKRMISRINNPILKVRHNVSRAVNFALKREGASKAGQSTMDYLPYTLDDLKKHLESKFEPWMNWSNYGMYHAKSWKDDDVSTWTWQVDHIIPHSEFKYDSLSHPDFKKCWSLENLRPYSSKKNCLEGASRVRHKDKKYED